jgi:hypothetical protein
MCPDEPRLSRFHDGGDDPELAEHLLDCAGCLRILEEYEAVDALIQTGLRPRPAILKLVALAAVAGLLAGLGLFLLSPESDEFVPEEREFAMLWDSASPSAVDLEPGGAVTTRAGQTARFDWPGAELLLNENSRVTLDSKVRLERGEIYAICARPIEIQTPQGEAKLGEGEFRIEPERLTAIRGSAEWAGAKVAAGEELRFDRGRPKLGPRPELLWPGPARQMLFQDRFDGLSKAWKTGNVRWGSAKVEGGALTVSTAPNQKKKFFQAALCKAYPVREGLIVEFDLRGPGGHVLFGGKSKLRWVFGTEEGFDGLWTRPSTPPTRWRRVRIDLSATEAAYSIDGAPVARVSHAQEKVALGFAGAPELQVRNFTVRRP